MTYPNGGGKSFPENMAALAAFLDGGLPIRCVSVNAPGSYDTHENEQQDLADGLKLTSDTLAAFQADLEARGLADRVITLVWSEFGRRPEQNDSDGTDHGAAGVGFVIGTPVKGQMLGQFPGLAQLDEDDNVRFTMDFRAVYCSILEQWSGSGRRRGDPERVQPRAPAGDRVRPPARAAAALAAAALVGVPLTGGGEAAGSHGPSRLLVKGVEYDLTLSRGSIAPGQAIVDFQNTGEDPHNLVVKRAGGSKAHDSGKPTSSGQVDQVHLKFRAGSTYVLFCSLKHHRAKGMVAHLSVSGG